MKKIILIALAIVAFAGSTHAATSYITVAQCNAKVNAAVRTERKFESILLDFTNNTYSYIECLWMNMRWEVEDWTCNDQYELYKNSWNIFYKNGFVSHAIVDYE